MITPDFQENYGRYICPECKRDYSWRWIRRHVIKEHGYLYWDNTIVYNPNDPANQAQTSPPNNDKGKT